MLVCHQRVQNNSIPSFIHIMLHIQCMTAVWTICPRLLIDVQTGNYKTQTLFCVLNARFYVNYRCLGMYFLIRQGVRINFKSTFGLMLLQSVFKYWWLKVFKTILLKTANIADTLLSWHHTLYLYLLFCAAHGFQPCVRRAPDTIIMLLGRVTYHWVQNTEHSSSPHTPGEENKIPGSQPQGLILFC